MLLLGPLPVALAAATLHRYPYGTSVRVTIYMAPAICLLTGEGGVALFRATGRGLVVRGPIVVAGLLAVMPLAYTVRDFCMPYMRWDDVEHRQLACMLAGWTAPGDQWIVFNGATPPPRDIPHLMISRWIQRVAEVRFYLLRYAPVPTRWEPAPEQVAAMPGGRTWLIIHRHGCTAYFPHERLAAYQRALIDRLGLPQSMTVPLPDHSSVEVWVFNPTR